MIDSNETPQKPQQKSHSVATKEKAFCLWVDGRKYQEIAVELDVEPNTINSWYTVERWKERLAEIKKDLVETGIVGIIAAGHQMLKTTIESAPIAHRQLWAVIVDPSSPMIDKKRAAETLDKLTAAMKIFCPDLSPDQTGLSGRSLNPALLKPTPTE